jgi:hypothetical protein
MEQQYYLYLFGNSSTTTNINGSIINLNGNIGIGTTDPKALLHVSGKTIIDSTIGATPSNELALAAAN